MVRWLTLAVALGFGATPVSAGGHSGGHGGGSHSGGSHSGGSHSGSHSGGHGHGAASHASGGTHADGRQAHSSSSSHAGDRDRPDSSSERRSSRTSAALPATDAERRHPRPGAARGDRFFDGVHTGNVRPYFGLRYRYSSGFFDPFFFGYSYFGGSPWPYGLEAPYPSGGYVDGGGYRGDLGLTAPWERPSADERDPDRDAGDPLLDRDEEGMDSVFILVHPADASIYIDDVFRGSGREVGRIAVTTGPHRVEVVRPGYRAVVRDFDIRPDEAKDLDIRLTPF
jgi:PEGA domain